MLGLLNIDETRLVPNEEIWKIAATFKGGELELHGNADMVILSATAPSFEFQHAQVVMEIKKTKSVTEPHSRVQAIAELLVVDQHADGHIVSVLTDLRNHWYFYWLGSCSTPRHQVREVQCLALTNLAAGVTTLRELLAGTTTLTHANYTCSCQASHPICFMKVERENPDDDDPDLGATDMDMRYGCKPSALRHRGLRDCRAGWLDRKSSVDLRAK